MPTITPIVLDTDPTFAFREGERRHIDHFNTNRPADWCLARVNLGRDETHLVVKFDGPRGRPSEALLRKVREAISRITLDEGDFVPAMPTAEA